MVRMGCSRRKLFLVGRIVPAHCKNRQKIVQYNGLAIGPHFMNFSHFEYDQNQWMKRNAAAWPYRMLWDICIGGKKFDGVDDMLKEIFQSNVRLETTKIFLFKAIFSTCLKRRYTWNYSSFNCIRFMKLHSEQSVIVVSIWMLAFVLFFFLLLCKVDYNDNW